MSDQRETILLNPANYNGNTRKWEVPILRAPGVKCIELHIDGKQIESNRFSVQKNVIGLPMDIGIEDGTRAEIIVELSTRNMLVSFWGPIIVAIIMTVGTVGQPILHFFGLLYRQPAYHAVDFTSWGYDPGKHEFVTEVQVTPARTVKHIPESELGDWRLYLVVRAYSTESDVEQHRYQYIGGPFRLSPLMKKSVKTDEGFTNILEREGRYAQGCIVLVRKEVKIAKGFRPSDYPRSQVRVIQAATCGR